MDEYIEEEIKKGTIKQCPHCSTPGILESGCNYIKCPICQGEWCFHCGNPKYKEIKGKAACNTKSHNSH